MGSSSFIEQSAETRRLSRHKNFIEEETCKNFTIDVTQRNESRQDRAYCSQHLTEVCLT